jgi:hypothetical protein
LIHVTKSVWPSSGKHQYLIEVLIRGGKHVIQDVTFFLTRQPPVGQGLLIIEVSRSHTTTQHSR